MFKKLVTFFKWHWRTTRKSLLKDIAATEALLADLKADSGRVRLSVDEQMMQIQRKKLIAELERSQRLLDLHRQMDEVMASPYLASNDNSKVLP